MCAVLYDRRYFDRAKITLVVSERACLLLVAHSRLIAARHWNSFVRPVNDVLLFLRHWCSCVGAPVSSIRARHKRATVARLWTGATEYSIRRESWMSVRSDIVNSTEKVVAVVEKRHINLSIHRWCGAFSVILLLLLFNTWRSPKCPPKRSLLFFYVFCGAIAYRSESSSCLLWCCTFCSSYVCNVIFITRQKGQFKFNIPNVSGTLIQFYLL